MPRLGDSGRWFAHLYCAVTAPADVLPSMGTHKRNCNQIFQQGISRSYTVYCHRRVEHCPFASSPDEVTCDPYREIRGPAYIPLAALQL